MDDGGLERIASIAQIECAIHALPLAVSLRCAVLYLLANFSYLIMGFKNLLSLFAILRAGESRAW